ncbi:MAG TPA: hypothetical protein VHR66_24875 [Gemmataceae bacterium]|jgi:hypothetical protein|nr:hypothetical protein [Gemmataceae bacterium]
MTIPVWVAELAASFWSDAGAPEPFPRTLLGPIALAVPLTVVFPPRPTIASILIWLQRNGIDCKCTVPDQPLRACLVARGGHGFAFIDGTDLPDEQRFSLAHELAHFLRDYLHPRHRVEKSLGPKALEVLDGRRPATAHERLHAILSTTPIGFHVHLMDREAGSGVPSRSVADAEKCADRLAYELLAPADSVLSAIEGEPQPATRSRLVNLLTRQFGLPSKQADQYADALVPPAKRDPLLMRLRGVG